MTRNRSQACPEPHQGPSMKSRFWFHCIFPDKKDDERAFQGKLAGLLYRRYPNVVFLDAGKAYQISYDGTESVEPDTDMGMPPNVAPWTLFIGLGTGALVAYNLQNDPKYRGTSLIAVCPPPGITIEPNNGSKVILYGSRDGTYGFPTLLGNQRGGTQIYGTPVLQHGPSLALYAVTYLVGKYMEKENISESVLELSSELARDWINPTLVIKN